MRGDPSALSPTPRRGMHLFEALGCVLCHCGPNFSDASPLGGQNPFRFFPAGRMPYEDKYALLIENGRCGTWRIPSLRNVALIGPWLHNGAVDELAEVIRIMAAAQLGCTGRPDVWLDGERKLEKIDRAPLGEQEMQNIVAFLESPSSDRLLAARHRALGTVKGGGKQGLSSPRWNKAWG